jgi:hypothetical protein
MGSGITRIVAGVYTGTGTAQDMVGDKVGFKPKRVTIHRMTTAIDQAVHVEGMATASFLKHVGATGVRTLVAAQGITLKDEGFGLGTDVTINASGDTYRFVAEE